MLDNYDYTNKSVTATINYPNIDINDGKEHTISKKYRLGETLESNEYDPENKPVIDKNCMIYAWYEVDGMRSAEGSIEVTNIDKDAPTFRVSTDDDIDIIKTQEGEESKVSKFTTSANSVTVISADALSGVSSVKYSKDGADELTGSISSNIFTEDGTYNITATDKAGNTTTIIIEIVESPSVKVTTADESKQDIANNATTNKDVEVLVNPQSIKNNQISVTKDGTDITNDITVENNKFTISGEDKDGVYKVSVEDDYRNKAEITFTISSSIPNAPVLTVETEGYSDEIIVSL